MHPRHNAYLQQDCTTHLEILSCHQAFHKTSQTDTPQPHPSMATYHIEIKPIPKTLVDPGTPKQSTLPRAQMSPQTPFPLRQTMVLRAQLEQSCCTSSLSEAQ